MSQALAEEPSSYVVQYYRRCRACGAAISNESRLDKRYCSRRCARVFWKKKPRSAIQRPRQVHSPELREVLLAVSERYEREAYAALLAADELARSAAGVVLRELSAAMEASATAAKNSTKQTVAGRIKSVSKRKK